MDLQTSWRVLHVGSHQERRVSLFLSARAVEHYLPLYSERRSRVDRKVMIELPLFPGYVFARFAPGQRLHVISTPGVLHLLGDNEHGHVGAEEVDRLRLAFSKGLTLRAHPFLAVGKRVRILRGVFAGAKGVVKELRSRCSVVLSLAEASQCFSLEAEPGDLEVLREAPVTDRGGNAGHKIAPSVYGWNADSLQTRASF